MSNLRMDLSKILVHVILDKGKYVVILLVHVILDKGKYVVILLVHVILDKGKYVVILFIDLLVKVFVQRFFVIINISYLFRMNL